MRLLVFILALSSLAFGATPPAGKLISIHLVNRSGTSETLSSKERLEAFQKIDFLAPQPYEKVCRVYALSKKGERLSLITSYHPNGQIKQFLEAINQRACGGYWEWYANGEMKVMSQVVGGVADLTVAAQETWLFDGVSHAWDEEGHLLAQISYSKGELEGESLYYHPNGALWKVLPYSKNRLHGEERLFLETGALLQTTHFYKGEKEGLSVRTWPSKAVAFEEFYQKGRLQRGHYFDKEGAPVAKVEEGRGVRALFGKEGLVQLQEYRHGEQEGGVKLFDEEGELIRTYGWRDGRKEGEELCYLNRKKRLSMRWQGGVLEGPVRSWYESGALESQKEMSQNQRNGLSTAWYPNGALMLVEEYEKDRLFKGEYFRLGESLPLSKVERGEGIATLFNQEGSFLRKILYKAGQPVE